MKYPLAITALEKATHTAPLLLNCNSVSAVEQAKKFGYQAIEFHVIDVNTFPTEAVKKACILHKIDISAIVTGQIYTKYGLSMCADNMNIREHAMRTLYQYVDLAALLDVKSGIVIGWVKGKCEHDETTYYKTLATQMHQLANYAKSKGQRILLEVINRYETNVFNTAKQAKIFIQTYGIENVYIHLDTFHMNIEEESLSKAILEANSLLGYIHFADSDRRYLGSGHIDFSQVIAALDTVKYQGYLSLECIPDPCPEIAAKKSLDAFQELLTYGNI